MSRQPKMTQGHWGWDKGAAAHLAAQPCPVQRLNNQHHLFSNRRPQWSRDFNSGFCVERAPQPLYDSNFPLCGVRNMTRENNLMDTKGALCKIQVKRFFYFTFENINGHLEKEYYYDITVTLKYQAAWFLINCLSFSFVTNVNNITFRKVMGYLILLLS